MTIPGLSTVTKAWSGLGGAAKSSLIGAGVGAAGGAIAGGKGNRLKGAIGGAAVGGAAGYGAHALRSMPKATAGASQSIRPPPAPKYEPPKWTSGVTSKADAKKIYRKKAFELHPDRGGSAEAMSSLNSEWDAFQKSDHFNKLSSVRLRAFLEELRDIYQEA